MAEELTIFEIMKPVLFWVSPVIFFIGLMLLFAEYHYRKTEDVLGKDIGGIRKKVMPHLEATIYTFHERLLSKRFIVGSLFILCSIVFFFTLKG